MAFGIRKGAMQRQESNGGTRYCHSALLAEPAWVIVIEIIFGTFFVSRVRNCVSALLEILNTCVVTLAGARTKICMHASDMLYPVEQFGNVHNLPQCQPLLLP